MHVQHAISMKQLLDKMTTYFSIKTNFIKTDGLLYKNDLFFLHKKRVYLDVWIYDYPYYTFHYSTKHTSPNIFFLLVIFFSEKKINNKSCL